MSDKFFLLANLTTDLVLLFTFFYSVTKLSKYKRQKNYLLIVIYLLIASIFCIVNELRYYKLVRININYYIPFALIHQFVLIKYIMIEIDKLLKSKFLEALFYSFIFIQFGFYYIDYNNESFYSASFSNFSILLYSVIYFYILFNNEISIEHIPKYSFLIIVGIFISTSLIFPIMIFGKYLFETLNKAQYHLIASIAPIASLIFYLFIFKSILCLEKTNT